MTAEALPQLSVHRVQGDMANSDVATLQTVRLMCRHIRDAARDPLVQSTARRACETWRGGPAWVGVVDPLSDRRARAESCWWWCKQNLRFLHDDDISQAMLNEDEQLEMLIS